VPAWAALSGRCPGQPRLPLLLPSVLLIGAGMATVKWLLVGRRGLPSIIVTLAMLAA